MPTTSEWLEYCLAKPGAWRDEPWENDVVVKVGDKIFAFFGVLSHEQGASGEQGGSVGVKCGDRESADLWLERYPAAASKMAYIGKHGWNTFQLDGTIPDDELRDLVDASYEQVMAKLPKSKRPRSSTP